MQFLSEGRYMANVVDGKVTQYGRRAGTNPEPERFARYLNRTDRLNLGKVREHKSNALERRHLADFEEHLIGK